MLNTIQAAAASLCGFFSFFALLAIVGAPLTTCLFVATVVATATAVKGLVGEDD